MNREVRTVGRERQDDGDVDEQSEEVREKVEQKLFNMWRSKVNLASLELAQLRRLASHLGCSSYERAGTKQDLLNRLEAYCTSRRNKNFKNFLKSRYDPFPNPSQAELRRVTAVCLETEKDFTLTQANRWIKEAEEQRKWNWHGDTRSRAYQKQQKKHKYAENLKKHRMMSRSVFVTVTGSKEDSLETQASIHGLGADDNNYPTASLVSNCTWEMFYKGNIYRCSTPARRSGYPGLQEITASTSRCAFHVIRCANCLEGRKNQFCCEIQIPNELGLCTGHYFASTGVDLVSEAYHRDDSGRMIRKRHKRWKYVPGVYLHHPRRMEWRVHLDERMGSNQSAETSTLDTTSYLLTQATRTSTIERLLLFIITGLRVVHRKRVLWKQLVLNSITQHRFHQILRFYLLSRKCAVRIQRVIRLYLARKRYRLFRTRLCRLREEETVILVQAQVRGILCRKKARLLKIMTHFLVLKLQHQFRVRKQREQQRVLSLLVRLQASTRGRLARRKYKQELRYVRAREVFLRQLWANGVIRRCLTLKVASYRSRKAKEEVDKALYNDHVTVCQSTARRLLARRAVLLIRAEALGRRFRVTMIQRACRRRKRRRIRARLEKHFETIMGQTRERAAASRIQNAVRVFSAKMIFKNAQAARQKVISQQQLLESQQSHAVVTLKPPAGLRRAQNDSYRNPDSKYYVLSAQALKRILLYDKACQSQGDSN